MKPIEYKWIDKSFWPRGEWDDEPDKAQWQDEKTQLHCLAVRTDFGHWCGYVAVNSKHPMFAQDYNIPEVEVHGGLTFGGFCSEDKEHGICHLVEDGEDDRVFWFGFDCAHSGDYVPGWGNYKMYSQGMYRTFSYVKEQCASLALQLYENR